MTAASVFPGVKSFGHVEEAGPIVFLEHEVDLDDLLLELLRQEAEEDPEWGASDRRTGLPSQWLNSYEAYVRWWRKEECTCGDDHLWDLAEKSWDYDPTPSGVTDAFLGVLFS